MISGEKNKEYGQKNNYYFEEKFTLLYNAPKSYKRSYFYESNNYP